MPSQKQKSKLVWQHWNEVEEKLQKEMQWLRKVISVFREKEELAPQGCRECFIRRIAIFIVSGEIEAKEITRSPLLKSFWLDKGVKRKKLPQIMHGSDWHRETMDKIESHFISLGYGVTREPTLAQGRADLGVYKKGEPNLLIEVGTMSFFKLWKNLACMVNSVYLMVPYDNRLVEFRRNKSYSIRSTLDW